MIDDDDINKDISDEELDGLISKVKKKREVYKMVNNPGKYLGDILAEELTQTINNEFIADMRKTDLDSGEKLIRNNTKHKATCLKNKHKRKKKKK